VVHSYKYIELSSLKNIYILEKKIKDFAYILFSKLRISLLRDKLPKKNDFLVRLAKYEAVHCKVRAYRGIFSYISSFFLHQETV